MNNKTGIILAALGLFLLSTRKASAATVPNTLYGVTRAATVPASRAYLANPSAAAQYASMNGRTTGNTQGLSNAQLDSVTSLINSGIRLFGGTVKSPTYQDAGINAAMSVADQYAQYGSGRMAANYAALPDYMPTVADAYGGTTAGRDLWIQEHADQQIIDAGTYNADMSLADQYASYGAGRA